MKLKLTQKTLMSPFLSYASILRINAIYDVITVLIIKKVITYLILLSMYLHQEIFYSSIDDFKKIRDFCLSTEIRYRKDEELYEFLSKEKDLSFIEGKQRFDELYKKY